MGDIHIYWRSSHCALTQGTALKGNNSLLERFLSFKSSSHFDKGRNWRKSLLDPVVSLESAYFKAFCLCHWYLTHCLSKVCRDQEIIFVPSMAIQSKVKVKMFVWLIKWRSLTCFVVGDSYFAHWLSIVFRCRRWLRTVDITFDQPR